MVQMGSIADNTSGGAYAYRASKCGLNMGTCLLLSFPWPQSGCLAKSSRHLYCDQGLLLPGSDHIQHEATAQQEHGLPFPCKCRAATCKRLCAAQ